MKVLLCLLACASIFPLTAWADMSETAVGVIAYRSNGNNSQGSGFFLGPRGLIATAYHVVADSNTIEIATTSGRRIKDVTVYKIWPTRDLALLLVDEAPSRFVNASSVEIKQGMEVRITGFPRGIPNTHIRGAITHNSLINATQLSDSRGANYFYRPGTDLRIISLDISVYGGMSGAAVLDENDEALGVLVGSLHEGRGMGWAIPLTYLTDAVPVLNTIPAKTPWRPFTIMNDGWRSLVKPLATPSPALSAKLREHVDKAVSTMKIMINALEKGVDTLQHTAASCMDDFATYAAVTEYEKTPADLHEATRRVVIETMQLISSSASHVNKMHDALVKTNAEANQSYQSLIAFIEDDPAIDFVARASFAAKANALELKYQDILTADRQAFQKNRVERHRTALREQLDKAEADEREATAAALEVVEYAASRVGDWSSYGVLLNRYDSSAANYTRELQSDMTPKLIHAIRKELCFPIFDMESIGGGGSFRGEFEAMWQDRLELISSIGQRQ